MIQKDINITPVVKDIHSFSVEDNADESIFYNKNEDKEFCLCSSATNWNRNDKRINIILSIADRIDEKILLIGKCDIKHKNIVNFGYIESQNKMNDILNKSSVFLSLFFRCAGSKVTCQAMKCELPVLFTSSGGLPEIVMDNGIMVNDYNNIDFLDREPSLNIDEILYKYNEIKNFKFKNNMIKYKETIKQYFDVINDISTNIQ